MSNWVNSNFYTGFSTGGHTDDTWTNLVNAGSANGTVNADPCPSDYRLPTVNDWLEVIPYSAYAGLYEVTNTGANDKTDAAELALHPTTNQVTIKTGPSSYLGAGDVNGFRTVFGVKTIEGRKYAYRWRYYATNLTTPTDAYLEISCMPVLSTDATGIATTVATYDDTLWSEMNGVEVRLFPATGCQGTDGLSYYRGTFGNYWSSSAYNATSGWYMHFSNLGLAINTPNRTEAEAIRCVAAQK